jgi:hypothetical protein
MCDDDAREAAYPGTEELLTKIGTAIDKHVLAGAFDQDRGPEARIAGLVRIAHAPFVADLRDTSGCPAAQYANFHAAFLKSLKKLAVVA